MDLLLDIFGFASVLLSGVTRTARWIAGSSRLSPSISSS